MHSTRDNEKKKAQKRKEKEQRKEERKASGKEGKSFEDMIAYVDENGNLTSTPPDLTKKKVIKESDIDLTSRNKGGSTPSYVRTGFIKFFDTSKGFGFIKDDQSQRNISSSTARRIFRSRNLTRSPSKLKWAPKDQTPYALQSYLVQNSPAEQPQYARCETATRRIT